MAREWWRTFFDGAWADVHTAVVAPERTAADVEAAERLLGLGPGTRVLDVPCGDGRISLPLAEHGCRVTGVDLSELFLDRARSAAAGRGLELDLHHRDMRDLPWSEEFDAVVCLWGSFGYFDEEGNAAFLQAARRTLRPGGRLLLATHVLETLLARFEPRGWSRIGETLVLEARRYEPTTSRVEGVWTFVRDGTESVQETSIRVYSCAELLALVDRAGFTGAEAYESPDKPFALGARRLLLVADA